MSKYGPKLPISEEIHSSKYRLEGEPFEDMVSRLASTLSDNDEHRKSLTSILLNMRFLPAGRVQTSIGAPKNTTAFNCFVSSTINDDFGDIMRCATEAGKTMRMGGGIGYDFSTLRPKGTLIKTLNSQASGPVSFMSIYDAVCRTIASSGHRRGAQMGVLRVDHPDIEEFIYAKRNSNNLTGFNISIAATDAFMKAVKEDTDFHLKWRGKIVKTVKARSLWDAIMRSNWDWGEPGILFIDRINDENNMWYSENIVATNPCGEQPLPPYGACLLGSFNLTKYVDILNKTFNYDLFISDIKVMVRAMDNIIDNTVYPLPAQETEAKAKRRMGLGVTGLANALEGIGLPYGSEEFLVIMEKIFETLRNTAYYESTMLAKEKGVFPAFNKTKYLQGKFIEKLPDYIKESIKVNGIRNSHLISMAPTGTISLTADNISSGIEPVFTHEYQRQILTFDGPVFETVTDFAWREWGIKGRSALEISVEDHVKVLIAAQKYVDSACSKTCNVGDDVSWERFKNVYMLAYDGGAKGCTTFRASGKRMSILTEKKSDEYVGDEDNLEKLDHNKEQEKVEACYFDPVTGQKSCG